MPDRKQQSIWQSILTTKPSRKRPSSWRRVSAPAGKSGGEPEGMVLIAVDKETDACMRQNA